MSKVEIIDFKTPGGENKSIYISKVPSSSKEELQSLLNTFYSEYGLIYCIRVFNRCQDEDYYAVINFYSEEAATRARLLTHGRQFSSLRMDEKLNIRAGHGLKTSFPLSLSRCYDLANYYFGFNGWSSRILYHKCEAISDVNATWATVVKLIVGDDVEVEGVGKESAEFNEDPVSKGRAFVSCQKRSFIAASVNAFQKLLIVVVDGKKVKAEIDPNVKDPFFYDPLWERQELDDSYLLPTYL